MAQIAAHLVDNVFPKVPIRQWVLSLPKRFRYFLHHHHEYISPVLSIDYFPGDFFFFQLFNLAPTAPIFPVAAGWAL